MTDTRQTLRSLPSVSDLLEDAEIATYRAAINERIIVDVIRAALGRTRSSILAGNADQVEALMPTIMAELHALASDSTPPIVNGTGVIVHTNLGRAPVSRETAEAMARAASHYLPLEVERESGQRGGRGQEVELMLRALTGAERALVVNNNAAAVALVLTALCAGKEVVVSRGEAVEIGGGFRIPDVLRQSGARLVEVGTTNRTYVQDYEAALGESTAAIMKIHASNFAIVGFTASASIGELASLANRRGVLALEDVGSGCLLDTTTFGLGREPTLRESIEAGADIVTASGDKLLGGPQAGIILGKAREISRVARHPLMRALRVDKTVQAGLAATLRHYLGGEAIEKVPIWWSISREEAWLAERVDAWIREIDDHRVSRGTSEAVVGGGSLPGMTLPSFALSIAVGGMAANELARRLRIGDPPVFPRVVDDLVSIDARTILPDEDALVVRAVKQVLSLL